MAISQFEADLNIISKLGDDPVREGLTTNEFRAKFDEGGGLIKDYINTVLVPAFNAVLAGSVVMSDTRPIIKPVLWFDISQNEDAEAQATAGYTHKARIVYIDALGSEHLLLPENGSELEFNGLTIPAHSFTADTTYPGNYPYRAAVALEGVLESMIPDVTFALADAISGNFAPVAESYNGGVYLYAADIPEADLTIPTILLWRGNA